VASNFSAVPVEELCEFALFRCDTCGAQIPEDRPVFMAMDRSFCGIACRQRACVLAEPLESDEPLRRSACGDSASSVLSADRSLSSASSLRRAEYGHGPLSWMLCKVIDAISNLPSPTSLKQDTSLDVPKALDRIRTQPSLEDLLGCSKETQDFLRRSDSLLSLGCSDSDSSFPPLA